MSFLSSIASSLSSPSGLGMAAGGALAPTLLAGTAAGMGTDLFNSYMTWQNYEMQKDKLAYDQRLQKDIFQREDNSIQRRVNDLTAAGLSPVLAAGNGAASGQVVSTVSPQMGRIDDPTAKVMNAITMANNIATSETQRRLMNQQAITSMMQGFLAASQKQKTDTEQKILDYDYEWWKTGGTNGSMPTKGAPGIFTGVGITNNALEELRKKYFGPRYDENGRNLNRKPGEKPGSSGNW